MIKLCFATTVLACSPQILATELVNPGFEADITSSVNRKGWEVTTHSAEVNRDFSIKSAGSASLRIDASTAQSSAMLRQEIPAEWVQSGVVRFSGRIKSESLDGTATLFVTVNNSKTRVFLDDMRDRPVQGSSEWTSADIRVPRILDAESVTLGVLVIGAGSAWFDDLSITKIESDTPSSPEASNYLEAALDIIETRSIHSKGANWPALRDEARAAAAGSQSTADTHAAIRYVLLKLGDTHSSLLSKRRYERLINEGADSKQLSKWQSPTGSIVAERIAYISVPRYQGNNAERMTAYADELQALIRDLDSPEICGWVVDLRQNLGGNVFAMLAGIGPVLGEGDAGGGIAADGTVVKRSYADGQSGRATVSGNAYSLINAKPSVAVLIGPNTASSGEAVALAFIGRPDARTFGQQTAGYTTGNVQIPLSDGAALNLSVSQMIDRNGNAYSGTITPDEVVDDAELARQKAVSWLRTAKSCRD